MTQPPPRTPRDDDPYIGLFLAAVCEQDRDESPLGWSELPPPSLALPEGNPL
ncbi:hypothetical protein ACFWH1_18690 [Streptomyces sp. NPDC127037]|uniref:hypothetical protein n=1 Tax=Streptomyces sp. NPDC127037 TaxID=3347113 RepID=UPI00364B088C